MAANSLATDSSMQMQLIAALQKGKQFPYPVRSVRLYETHISWVLLAGRYAYKIKKALNLGFLDFTNLERRHFYCNEEIHLNRRTAPQLYLDTVPIGGTADHPVVGLEPAIEYAVRMRRFSVAAEMDRLMANGKVLPAHIDSLAAGLAHFHMSLPPIELDSPYGGNEAMRDLTVQNSSQWPIPQLDKLGEFIVQAIQGALEDEYTACVSLMANRRAQGFVRECHGDLHLGNIVIKSGKAIPFDCIEFDPELRWIDILCDIAFPFMDLQYFKREDLAWRLLNVWLEITGDYGGLALLQFYASYRAAVRAKVNAIRASQMAITGKKKQEALQAFRQYLALSCHCLMRQKPALIITHGLPGSGKTTFAQMALERFGAIRIRSDVERKRLFGMSPLERSKSATGGDIYSLEATERTYDVLLGIARGLIQNGYRVIVDAAFLKPDERAQFRQLAQEMSAPFVIASILAGEAAMRTWVEQRNRRRKDASEANVSVLETLQAANKPLEDKELAETITFFNNGSAGFAVDDPAWRGLEALLG